MGTVYRALDEVEGLSVALKVVRNDEAADVERFTREVAILAELRHPAIVRYVAHGCTAGDERYVAMEWLEGEDLATALRRRLPAPSQCLAVVLRIAEALGFAHERGVIHRDVKPSNIFLSGGEFERAKLIDFGIARGARDGPRLTLTGAIVGTPGYMSPEQIQAKVQLDARSDVFSLGCVLFECLTGRTAFEGMNLVARLAKILLGEVPRLRAVLPSAPSSLDALLTRMLAKDREQRPRDGAALAVELRAVRDEWLVGPSFRTSTERESREMSSSRRTLTLLEQRLVTVVLAGDPAHAMEPFIQEVRAAVEPHGGHLDALAGGSFVVTVWGAGSTVERAERAAQCALSIRSGFPALPICLTTGRGRTQDKLIEGEVIDSAAQLLTSTRPGEVRLDEGTADMLRARFDVAQRDGSLSLRGERAAGPGLLLGKPTPYAGRSRETATLEGALSGCRGDSAACAVLVTGPAGSGKSRLCGEFLEALRRRRERVEVLLGKGDSLGAASAFSILADAIRRASEIRDGEPVAVRRAKLAARVGRHLDGRPREHVVAFLGEMIGTPSPGDAIRAFDNALLRGDRMRAAWEEWLAAECAAAPVILVLEDLQWGDAATVQLVDASLRNLAELPLLVVALARPEVDAQFPGLWADRAVQTIRLAPLGRKVCEKLVTDALGLDPTATVVRRVVDRAAGNPFVLEELIRAVAAGRGDTFPDSVLGMIEARLDAEGSEAKRVLRAASVFGERFSRSGVLALLGQDHGFADEWLELLSTRELIVPVGPRDGTGHASFAFRHAMVREAAYAMLTEADRALGHHLAAEFLEGADGGDAMAVAEHFHRGGGDARAVKWYLRAAEQALGANDLGAALTRAGRGVTCGALGEELGALRLIEAEAHVWRGDLGLAEQRGAEAITRLPRGTAAWFHAVVQAANAAGKLGAFDRVEGWISDATGAAPEAGAASARVMCLSAIATHLIFGGRYAAADGLLDTLLPDSDGIEPQALAGLQETRAIRAVAAGDLGAGLDGFEAALSAFEQVDDQRHASVIRSNLGFILVELGDFAGAEEVLREAISAADRMGLHDLAIALNQNLGRALARQGRVEDGRMAEQRALDASLKQGDPRMAGVARAYLAQIAILAGDFEAAEREGRAAVDALVVAPPARAAALAVLGQALLAQGRVAEALPVATEAFSQLEELGSIDDGESLVRLVFAEVLAARRDPRAAAAAAGACDHLGRRAARISDPVWRERFLYTVPENRRTMALGQAPRNP